MELSGDADFPPEPWDLTGDLLVGVWLVPHHAAPPPHAPGTRQVRVLGRALVAAAFFVYTEPSPLTYHEVMATQVVRRGLVPRVSITHIWVDSPSSRDGGRALWAIPKGLAAFEITGDHAYAATGIASARVTRTSRWAPRLPVAFTVAQQGPEGLRVSPVRGSARLAVARARWRFDADGPLGFLAGRRPLVSLAGRPFRLTFGQQASA